MKETLCWTCSVPGTGGCSWDREFIPVEGWTATPTRIWQSWAQDWMGSFVVHACPLFQAAVYRSTFDKLLPKTLRPDGCQTKPLMAVCDKCKQVGRIVCKVNDKPWCDLCLFAALDDESGDP